MDTTTDSLPTLVLGGTGHTGRRVMDRLTARGVPARVGSRSGEPPFDWNDSRTWDPVLDGVRAVYLCCHPDLAVPGAAATVAAVAAAAVSAGAERLVLLSGRGEAEAEHAETLVRQAGAGAAVTVVRASWFAQNFSESFLLDAVLAGELALPVGNVREPFVDIEDIADVVVAALTEDGHAGELYDVTGPRLLSFADAADEIAQAAGIEVRARTVPLEEYVAGATAAGASVEETELMAYLFTEVLDGRNESVTDGVEQALGRPATDFAVFAARAAAEGTWTRRAAVVR
ncbi:Rossmann-fold NAD(P)-binding domain-containing protein [Georgenia subflava]|uniref:NmrA family transcriptional regulator n=1 Tax=Georgenia subflava TaxID=1622177 RepID=A0A6N7EHA0_9MICO|nr:NmrA family transcriptional regulator [Georgenia subflava]MPV36358.1 NmrA family transcriptional regulator [Georgenia subflava]